MRLSRKKNPTNIVSVAATKDVDNNINSHHRRDSSGAASVVSLSCSEVSSIASDSECDQSSVFAPMTVSSQSQTVEDECPQTGDCLDFEGRSYFFVDEEEIEEKTIPTSNVAYLRKTALHPHTPAEIPFRPSNLSADVSPFREFFFRDFRNAYASNHPQM
jgi:hypothetical protein